MKTRQSQPSANGGGLYQELVETNPDVVFRLNLRPEVQMEYINPAAERVLGHPLVALRSAGLPYLQSLFAEEEWDDVLEVSAGRHFHPVVMRRMCRADGAAFWAEIHNLPVYDRSGTITRLAGTIRDVTARQSELADLHQAERRQRTITESLPELLFRVDESGSFTEQIPTASRQPARLFLGKGIPDVVPLAAREDARRLLAKALGGTPGTIRCRIQAFGDEPMYEIRLLPCGSGELLAFLRDVTEEIWDVSEKGRLVAPAIPEGVIEAQMRANNPYEFTFRELTVLHLLAKGWPDWKIGVELGISPSTTHKHVSTVLSKMGADSRTEAAVRAIRERLVSP